MVKGNRLCGGDFWNCWELGLHFVLAKLGKEKVPMEETAFGSFWTSCWLKIA